ncbi:MAG: alpha-isopropylmalate synthase regulatory domain-containing protein [Nanoarchaeota archaeon]
MNNLEIYDTTLREGEQAAGASFNIDDRVKVCKKLDDLGVDYIEVGWPFASKETFESFKPCMNATKNAEVVAFGSTSIDKIVEDDGNLKSLIDCGASIACIFGKTHPEHVEKQLKITLQENLKRITDSSAFLIKNNVKVFYDAEHYFDSFKLNKNYAIFTLASALKGGAERLILCDTNGGTLPNEAESIVKETKNRLENFGTRFELGLHFHDDSGLALANTLACLPYARQVQGTINGIGERVGNLNLSEFLPIYMKKMGNKRNTNLKLLKKINEDIFRIAGIDIPESRAFVGDTAFAHKGGVHTDATLKGLSYEHEIPEEFGNKRTILLNTLGGRACVTSVAKEFGYELNKTNPETISKIESLFEELKSLEERGYRMGAVKAEKYLLIEKYFGDLEEFCKIEEWEVNTKYMRGKERSTFKMNYELNGELFRKVETVDGGPVDAAYKTIKAALKTQYQEIGNLKLKDFHVNIAKSRGEESSVRTIVYFNDGEEFETIGVDPNIIQSAVEALEKGFRYYLNRQPKKVEIDLKMLKNNKMYG